MQLVDRTHASPQSYRRHTRAPGDVDLVVLHQTGTPRMDPSTSLLDRTRAHLLVLDDGEVRLLHPLLARLRYGSSVWNARCITLEVRANLPTRYTAQGKPIWWRPDLAGSDTIEAKVEQVRAVREVLAWLKGELPALRFIGAHRQIEASKGGCCGPDLHREVVMYAARELGYERVATDARGSEPPSTWLGEPRIADAPGATVGGLVRGSGREYAGPLAAAIGASPNPLPSKHPPPTPQAALPLDVFTHADDR